MTKIIGGFRGCTAYEAWAWRLYIRVPYWRFLRAGCAPTIGWDGSKINEWTLW